MSEGLATRCSACGTVFRVVPDQLRVSEGWVRCGRCAEVFNAAQALLDAQTGEPRNWSEARSDVVPAAGPGPEPEPNPSYDPAQGWLPAQAPMSEAHDAQPQPQPQPQPGGASAPPPDFAPVFVHEADLAPESPFETTQVLPPPDVPERSVDLEFEHHDIAAQGSAWASGSDVAPEQNASAPAVTDSAAMPTAPGPPAQNDAPSRPFDVEAMIDATVDPLPEPAASTESEARRADGWGTAAAAPGSRLDPPFAPADSFSATPSFVRRAERAERWRQPGVRAGLAVVLLLGLLALAAQVAYVYRDLLAARLPATRPLLDQGCAWIGCTVGAARVIDGLTVESSGLVRVAQTDAYQLSIALRNRSAIDLALPAVELSLTDSQGKLLARRVLRMPELGATQPALAAGRDLQLQATLRSATEPVAGYAIELFYP